MKIKNIYISSLLLVASLVGTTSGKRLTGNF